MGMLLRLEDYADRRSARAGESPTSSAEILLFMGVRYERMSDETDDGRRPTTPRSGRRSARG